MWSRSCKVIILGVLLVLSLSLVGCERPFPDNDTSDTPTEETTPDPNMGGGVPGDITETPVVTPEAVVAEGTPETESETPREEPTEVPEPTEEATPEPTAVADPESGGVAPAEDTEMVLPDETETAVAEEPAAEPEESPAESESATAINEPIAHVVQTDENLFRIGLQYGLSWLVIAEYNDIANPTQLTVGDTILIPPADPVDDVTKPQDPGPTPSPLTETIHVVQAGENLFRIGLQYGMSWTQVAEANGIVNPNQIYVGQELKIPVNTPGPAPEFTHVVQQGETLFMIAVRYGVPWTAVAEANNIQSPYVIYEGQALIIPGG